MAGLEGTNLGPYQVKALLGAGGMGQVYRAHDPRLEREVAIKVMAATLAQESGYLERFRREARAVAQLNHPNIVQVYDFGEQSNLTYLVMPLISGGTLRDYLAKRGALSLDEALPIIEQVAGALQYAHERGIIHRDVKPANILLSDDGRALLSDFGIVRLVQRDDAAATLTRVGAFVGSPEYAAPEMILGQSLDHRVDVYALGVMLYQMLAGRLPFAGPTPVSLMMMQAQQPPPAPRSLNAAISPAVEAVILKALAKAPAERYQSAAELLAALRAVRGASLAPTAYSPPPVAGAFNDLPTVAHDTPLPAGSGSSGWAAPPSGLAGTPPPLPTFATGLSMPPNQPQITPTGLPSAPAQSAPPRRKYLIPVLVLVIALVLVATGGGALALTGFFRSAAITPVAQRSPGATNAVTPSPALPPPTPTPVPTSYYMAHNYVVMAQDLENGDTTSNPVSIQNNQYVSREGPKGDLYQMGDALTFGRAFGTAQLVRGSDGSLKFIVLVDRFDTYQHADQYFMRDEALIQGTPASMQVGEEAAAGVVPAANGKQTYQLFFRDRNIMVVIATVPMSNPQRFSDYFISIAQAIAQRGERCTYDPTTLKVLPGNPSDCN